MTSRRAFICTLAGGLLAAPRAAEAQQAGKVYRIGFLGGASQSGYVAQIEALRLGLQDRGYVEGRNIAIEYRWAEGKYDRLPALAAELVSLKVEVIVTHAAVGALAAKQATASNPVPVVITNVGDAVGSGIVASLARPGGNITGDTFFAPELAAKRLEVLRDAIPQVRRVAVLVNPDSPGTAPQLQAMESTVKALNITLVRFDVRGPADLDGAFAAMAEKKVDAVVVNEGDINIIASVKSIAEQVARLRLPSIGFIEFVDAGGLFGYGVNFLALYRRAPVFVDKILRGAKPADIPVERPTTFDFVINMKTAKALGLAVASATRLRADRLID